MAYSYDELVDAYRRIGVVPGRVVYATSELTRVADYEVRGSKPLIDAHYRALREILGAEGTLVVPAASINLCNTDIPFDLAGTPSFYVGSFSEYVRRQPEALRSFHPFVSYAAIGARAEEITANVCRHAYGPQTPEDRLIEMDSLSLCIGVDPLKSISTVHHVEHVMAVPFRYTKEFIHPVTRDGAVVPEPFYMQVWYRDIGYEKDYQKKLFARIGDRLAMTRIELGRAVFHAFSTAEFYHRAIEVYARDIYVNCKNLPSKRPYRD